VEPCVFSDPDGHSKLCLSCHDGTVAVDSFGGRTGTSFLVSIGTDLRNHHPISFDYDSALALADGELHDPATTPAGGGTIRSELLFDDRLQCSSCHDVHISRNSSGCTGCHVPTWVDPPGAVIIVTRSLSLRIDNAASALCLACHDK
jgi:hypothetical protein